LGGSTIDFEERFWNNMFDKKVSQVGQVGCHLLLVVA